MNAAALGSRDDHDVRLCFRQKAFGLLLPFEINLAPIGGDDLAFGAGETAGDRGADHAAMPCDIDTLAGKLEYLCSHQTVPRSSPFRATPSHVTQSSKLAAPLLLHIR